MKLAFALATLACASLAHADPLDVTVHLGLSDGAQYDVTVAKSGVPTALLIRDGAEVIDIKLRLVDAGRLRYEIKRSGAHPFALDGEAVPPRGRPSLIGHLPYAGGACDVRLRVTDG